MPRSRGKAFADVDGRAEVEDTDHPVVDEGQGADDPTGAGTPTRRVHEQYTQARITYPPQGKGEARSHTRPHKRRGANR